MLEDTPAEGPTTTEPADQAESAAKKTATKKTAAKKTTTKSPAKKSTARKTTTKKAAEPEQQAAAEPEGAPAEKTAAKKSTAKKTTAKKTAAKKTTAKKSTAKKTAAEKSTAESPATEAAPESSTGTPPTGTALLFQPPEPTQAPARTRKTAETPSGEAPPSDAAAESKEKSADSEAEAGGDEGEGASGRRRRRRGGRRRRKSGGEASEGAADEDESAETEAAAPEEAAPQEDAGETSSRRRRRRRRSGDEGADDSEADPKNTVTKVRKSRTAEDQITAVTGSTRLEAKKQRRREGREAGRRRAPIVSEAEFLARREAVERVMVIRQRGDLTQIAVLEDGVLVEHYVARESQTSLIGNVYLGRVQNVLPSMEAAFVDIGKGRNAVLYAGEVNWSGLGHKDGQPRKIESVLSSGQSILVQVTKDPVGHKGARLTSQISLAGRFLVYVPDGTTSGISRKLPDTERNRLKNLLKEIVPDTAGVIVRTAAEGASEDELTRDVERLKARWEDIESKTKGGAPKLLYGEPDLTLKVVRDLFTEDFKKLVIEGEDAWDTVQGYVVHVAPDLEDRLEQYTPGENGKDVFAAYRIDEQIAKGLDRKVWLPSGGSLVIDRTEAMTVVDVNTGKFTGSGGNLEETVTKNNLEAAEEIVRQLRVRDVGGIIVIDFIDMVLESNRDLVVRRLVECLGRDRTRHQVAEVTSLGLVQMTRKRIGTGLLEAFSENCEHCQGRGVVIQDAPVEPKKPDDDSRRSRRSRGGRGRGQEGDGAPKPVPSPKDLAAVARPEPRDLPPPDGKPDLEQAARTEGADEDRPAEPVAAAAGAPVAPEPAVAVTTRSRRSASHPGGPTTAEPVEAVRLPEPAEEIATPAVPEPDAAEATPAAPPSEPEPPKVVTRTRRRSASRPAGPPVVEAEESTQDPVDEPVDEPAPDPGPGPLPDPPGAIGSVGEPPASGTVEPGTADAEPGTGQPAPVEHVPVKRKGSRKR